MRRLLTFAAFLLIISVVPVCAQRGGGHSSSGGSHGGFSGGHASFGGGHVGGGFSGGHISGGFGSHAGFVSHGAMGAGSHFVSHMGSRQFFSHGGQFGHGRFDHRFRNRFGYGYGYPYYGYPYYSYLPGIDPNWWWDSYPSDDAEQRQMADEMNQENLEEQQALREQDQDAYAQARPVRRQREPAASEKAENDPPTILLFRDQHTREIQNYAIIDEMVWIFTPTRIEKVPLAVLDVPATIQANENRGVEFRLPGVSQGQ